MDCHEVRYEVTLKFTTLKRTFPPAVLQFLGGSGVGAIRIFISKVGSFVFTFIED